ncbi:iron complex transport system permease protein [bacterium A37T11]|nr:iron complex transport system permease protein [bacterium A37T11]
MGGLLVLLLMVMTLSVCLGAVSIPLDAFFSIVGARLGLNSHHNFLPRQEAVLWVLRFPRTILAMLIGAGLATSGAAFQGLFRNPLAEPGLIGISSGASLFAVAMIVLEVGIFQQLTGYLGYYALSVAAFIGACLTTFMVYRLSIRHGKADIASLLLVGIAMNALAGAFIGLMTYMATDEQLRTITFWSLGSLGGATWQSVFTVMPFIGIPLLVLPFLAKSLNAFSLGDATARHMGINTNQVKRNVIILATMAVGGSVAVAGIIGFIGLIIPHMIRMAFSADHRLVIPGSALLGASVLTGADLLARTVASPAELPIGIVTSLIGVPVFIYIIVNQKKRNSDD